MNIAVYPGSFDPLTNGHVDIVGRALKIFDRLIVAIAVNNAKSSMFSVEERRDMIQETFKDQPRVDVDSFAGLLVEYLKSRQAIAVIRGLRAVSDFEYEFQMANMNRKLYPEAETLFLMTGHKYFYVSSRMIREVASLGGCLSDLVPGHVASRLVSRFGGR